MADKESALPEFNPRSASPSPHNHHLTRWPLNSPPFPPNLDPCNAPPLSAPKWWVSPRNAAGGGGSCSSAGSVYGRGRLLNHAHTGHPRLSMAKDVSPSLPFLPTNLNRNNPYLDAVVRSPSASWHQTNMVQQQQANGCTGSAADEWSCATTPFSSLNATSYPHPSACPQFDGDQNVVHPVYSDQALSAHQLQEPPARATQNRQHYPLSSFTPNYVHTVGDSYSNFKLGEDVHGCGADPLRLVGKSQSMRALYEENAALRHALYTMRRGTLLDHNLALQGEQVHPIAGEHDRFIASDVAEGRALSMRERGRWAMQVPGEVPAGAGGYNHGCPMWAGTPGQQIATPTHSIQNRAGMHRRPHRYHQHQWWEDVPAEHPLFYGGSFDGWPEGPMCGSGGYHGWADMHNECQRDVTDEPSNCEGLSLKQLLVQTDHLGRAGEKWRRQGKKKALRGHQETVMAPKAAERLDSGNSRTVGLEEGQCAMCGGKLQQMEALGVSAKKAALPLQLCPACHPRAAASLPHSTTAKSPPLSSTHARHRVATAIFMACRPTTMTNPNSNTSKKLKPKSRIVDICRQFVGLSTKPPST